MSTTIPSPASARSRYTVTIRHHGHADERTRLSRRDLAAANIQAAIQRNLADAPPLSDEQADTLAALLRGGGQ